MTTIPNFFNMLPFSGSNWQTIDTNWWSPPITVNFAGNSGIEREVVEDVASFGSQIGWLNDIVVALAAAMPEAIANDSEASAALKKLEDARVKIDKIKKRRKASALDKARSALENLGAVDKDGYARLVRSLNPDKPLGAS